jgi:hypothetical protein
MAGSAASNTLGSYTVLRKLKGALLAPGRVYAAHNATTGHPALVMATHAAEYTPRARGSCAWRRASTPAPSWRWRC